MMGSKGEEKERGSEKEEEKKHDGEGRENNTMRSRCMEETNHMEE